MSKIFTAGDRTYRAVTEAAEVTEEILDIARQIESGWYVDSPIDWEDVWDRMEGTALADGHLLSMGDEFDTPAMRKIQRVIRKERRFG